MGEDHGSEWAESGDLGEYGSSRNLKVRELGLQREDFSLKLKSWLGILCGTVESVLGESSEEEESGIEPRQDTEGNEAAGRRDGGIPGHGVGIDGRVRRRG